MTMAVEMKFNLMLFVNIKNLLPLRAIYRAIIMVDNNTNLWKPLSLRNIVEAIIKTYNR
jgi:hypothetical protein